MFYFKPFFLFLLSITGLLVYSTSSSQAPINSNAKGKTQSIRDSNQLDALYNIPGNIDSKFISSSKSLEDYLLARFQHVKIVSGEVWFSGAGFPFVERVLFAGGNLNGSGLTSLKSYFARCRAGSEITFQKCIFITPHGSNAKPANRSVHIQ